MIILGNVLLAWIAVSTVPTCQAAPSSPSAWDVVDPDVVDVNSSPSGFMPTFTAPASNATSSAPNGSYPSPTSPSSSSSSSTATNSTASTLVWLPCPQASKTSFMNMTFEPHPMVRGRMVTAKLRGFIDEDIPEGTRLVLSSYKSGFSMLPGPKFDIDVCQFIRDSFPDAPTPIQCPLNQWAIKLVLLSLQRKEEEAARNRDEYDDFEIVADGESDAGDDTKTMSSGNKASATQQGNGTQAMTFRVPRFMIRGSYRSRLTLVTGENRVLTCAETELVVV